jgi:hypothetical protein
MNPVEFLAVQPFAPLSGQSGQKNNSELNTTNGTQYRTETFQPAIEPLATILDSALRSDGNRH